MALKDWSTTPASNASAGSINFAEGQAPSTLNNSARQMMADLKEGLFNVPTDVASASTTDLGAVASNYCNVTGTTTITSFGTVSSGIWKFVKFAGALTLTHNATSLILPSGANITTAAGDSLLAVSEGSGNWRVLSYTRADGAQIIGYASQAEAEAGTNNTKGMTPLRTEQLIDKHFGEIASTSLSGTSTTLTFPSGVKWISVGISAASLNGATNFIAQLGDAGGTEATGYNGAAGVIFTTNNVTVSNPTVSFRTETASDAAVYHGIITLQLVNSATNTWAVSGHLASSNSAAIDFFAGSKALSAELTTVVFASGDGTSTFDGGTVAALYRV